MNIIIIICYLILLSSGKDSNEQSDMTEKEKNVVTLTTSLPYPSAQYHF